MSMNTLHEGACGRTKADIAAVRHIFMDIDEDGDQALRDIRQRRDLPAPSFLMNTSPDKWQVVWKVENFTKEQAEVLQKGLAHESGADLAATDCSRVLRLPGFYNSQIRPPISRSLGNSRSAEASIPPRGFPALSTRREISPRVWTGAPGFETGLRRALSVGARLGIRQARAGPRRSRTPGRRGHRKLPPLR